MCPGLILPLAAALLAAGAPVPSRTAEAAEPAASAEEEFRLADACFEQGLHDFVILRVEKLLKRRTFEGADHAELLLAKSLYLSGRRDRAVKSFEEFARNRPTSGHLLECRVWIGRAKVEFEHKAKEAAALLHPMLQELVGPLGRTVDERERLISECRYFLCLALVEQGQPELLDDLYEEATDRRGNKFRMLKRRGALTLLDEQVQAPSGARFVAEAHVLRGRALCMRGRPDECFDLLQTKFLTEPIGQAPANLALRAEALYWQAEARYGQANWEKAIELYSRSAETAASAGSPAWRDRALYGRGWARQKRAQDLLRSGIKGDTELLQAALADFEQVTKGTEKDRDEAMVAAAQLRAGETLVLLGKFREALAALEPLRANPARATEALYLAATAAIELKQHDRAEKLIDEAGKLIHDDKDVLKIPLEMARGRNAFARGDWVAAEAAFRQIGGLAGARSNRAHEAQLWLARIQAQQGHVQEAINDVMLLLGNLQARDALRLDCLDYYLGAILLQKARSTDTTVKIKGIQRDARAEAARAFVEAYQTSPLGTFAIESRFGAAEAYLLMKPPSTQEAFLQFTEIVQDSRASAAQRERARLGMALALRSSGSYQKAAALLQTELLEAGEPVSKANRLEALRLRAEVLADGGEAEAAAAAYQLLIKALPPGPESAPDASRAKMRLAEQLSILGRHSEAAREMDSVIEAGVKDKGLRAEAVFAAAAAEESAGRLAEALKRYLEYAALGGPQKMEAQLRAARLQLAAGRSGEAEDTARKALDELSSARDLRPGVRLLLARAASLQAEALMALANPVQAASLYRRAADEAAVAFAAETPPPSGALELRIEALLGLGQALLKARQPEEAAVSFLRAAQLLATKAPERSGAGAGTWDSKALRQAALALQQAGQPKAAEQVLELAAKQKPAPPPSAPRSE